MTCHRRPLPTEMQVQNRKSLSSRVRPLIPPTGTVHSQFSMIGGKVPSRPSQTPLPSARPMRLDSAPQSLPKPLRSQHPCCLQWLTHWPMWNSTRLQDGPLPPTLRPVDVLRVWSRSFTLLPSITSRCKHQGNCTTFQCKLIVFTAA
jgi:hypothetical protein